MQYVLNALHGTHAGQLHATQGPFLAHQVTQGWTRPHVRGDGWETAHVSETGNARFCLFHMTKVANLPPTSPSPQKRRPLILSQVALVR